MAIPKTFLIGCTKADITGVQSYLLATGQLDFLQEFIDAINDPAVGDMAIVSFYAKLCYRSLVTGKNANVTRVRGIEDNIRGCFSSGHGSVFEHFQLNFVTTDCSRVFTHELVRHRVGMAFSQTSGRYCTVEDAELVLPPELEQVIQDAETCFDENDKEVSESVCIAQQMRELLELVKIKIEGWREYLKLDDPSTDFATKKRLTSALRRIMPNGATNEIGWSCNIRSLRHVIEMRTSRHAEWEIRKVFHDVAEIVRERWPLMLHGGKCESVDGLNEWTGLKV